MLDESIPLTVMEYEEWGNPNDPEYFDYIRSYSPYDNVHPDQYPAMLVTAGLNDPRVGFWEPAKWVAKLRTMKTDHNPLLLRTHMGAGHSGASGRYDVLREVAEEYAFVIEVGKTGRREDGKCGAGESYLVRRKRILILRERSDRRIYLPCSEQGQQIMRFAQDEEQGSVESPIRSLRSG
jgi:hypothetical protein